MEIDYKTSAATAEQLPPCRLPEAAFVGRSNCGKSSLLNALVGRKALARESRTPGRTQMVNFFEAKDRFYIVDLPGYGFARAEPKVKENWQNLVQKYLERKTLQLIFFLVDSRREPDEQDTELLEHCERMAPTVLVLTKIDKLNQKELRSATARWQSADKKPIFAVSTLQGKGIKELQTELFRGIKKP